MPVNSTHPDYDAALPDWCRARDVLAGERAVKAAGEKYLPRLDSQSDEEFAAYVKRAAFFNATGRSADGYLGLVFRRPPFVGIPDPDSGIGRVLSAFANDADMLGTTLSGYARNVTTEIMGVGRAGSLVDWEEVEKRVYVSLYLAEQIINWRVERVNGRNVPTLIVLKEAVSGVGEVGFQIVDQPQIRVLKLVRDATQADGSETWKHVVEIWRTEETRQRGRRSKSEWVLAETKIPLRLGKPLPLIPFIFHGPRHSRPDVDRPPLADIISVNLDHYRLDADYKHGMHFTALPTAWVSGFDKSASLRIGASTAWVSETPGATAGYLEFTGQGLMTFERAMDRDEKLLAILGSRLLNSDKKVGETAEAIRLRQSGEESVLSAVASSVSESLTQVLRWVYWWNSTEPLPNTLAKSDVTIKLNNDFGIAAMSSLDLQATVGAWQAGAISRDTMFELFRRGEILPDGRTNEDEEARIAASPPTFGAGKVIPVGSVSGDPADNQGLTGGNKQS